MDKERALASLEVTWHSESVGSAFEALNSSQRGLTSSDASARSQFFGANSLPQRDRISALAIFLRQFRSSLLIILAAAAVFSFLNSESFEGIAILAILLLNGLLGFYQEYKAENAVISLRTLTRPTCKVRRDGELAVIDPATLVPGDVVVVEAGDRVPADCRVIIARDLLCNESPLTGESMPVEKATEPQPTEAILAERSSMFYMGTTIVRGAGEGLVVAIGLHTELGKIAQLLSAEPVRELSPLQKTVEDLSKKLGWMSFALVVVVFLLGMMREAPSMQLLMLAVSVAIAAIPEGLPAIVTIALSLGTSAMAKRNAIVRKLAAIETLGTTTVICTDKTGTLTTGEMTVRETWTQSPEHLLFVLAGCETAQIGSTIVGDPTEVALLKHAASKGVHQQEISERHPELLLLPFDSERKMMSVVRGSPNNDIALLAKGAPDVILAKCSRLWIADEQVDLSNARREEIHAMIQSLASNGMRLIATATKDLKSLHLSPAEMESELTFAGLVALADPPRQESKQMISACKNAGIEVKMITGDHPKTAASIARELGIVQREEEVLSGSDLDHADPIYRDDKIQSAKVFARVSPAHKLLIVNALKAHHEIVAMTGDGVNDAPAIAGADIGLAMGRSGTDVAKDASDIIIVDDNFATIARAVEYGRSAFKNIRKSVDYLLTGNITELALMGMCFAFALPTPLTAIQLLWINLITDGLPALTLAAEGVQPGVMSERPRNVDESLTGNRLAAKMAGLGVTNAVFLFFAYYLMIEAGGESVGRSFVFMLLVLSEMFRSLSYRDPGRHMFMYSLRPTLPILTVIVFSIGLQLLIILTDWGRRVFELVSLKTDQLMMLFVLSLVPLVVAELWKVLASFRRARGSRG